MRFVLGYGLNDINHMIDVAVAAEAAGFDSFTIGDSLFYPKHTDSIYPYKEGDRSFLENIDFLDPVAAIAAMAVKTSTIRFYPGVLKLPCRHPILTAKQFSSLAAISNNRVLLGVGISPWKEDLTYLGVDWDHRGKVMDECLTVIRGVLKGGFFGFDGEFYKFGEIKMRPVPSKPIPILVGGHSTPALRRAAKLGDGWMSAGGTLEENKSMVEKINQFRREFGTAGKPFEIHAGVMDFNDTDAMKRMVDMGATHIFTAPWNVYEPIASLQGKIDAVKRFGDNVIAKLG
ncbi:MAG TPA: TIGR03619 family F420-dependent LLM class oxidoreductase [Alphaproteobacteria bacterium]|nr:TIGR03619 family F420-dependent LLM class oxidoreductase [Alphaproteobacteria bacterium]